MGFDGLFLQQILLEISPQILKGRIDSLIPIKSGFVLGVYHLQSYNLIFDLNPQTASLYLTTTSHPKYLDNHALNSFLESLAKIILGAIIVSVEQYSTDRLVIFNLEKKDFLLGVVNYHLIFEIFGKRANVILTSEQDLILHTYKRDLNNLGRTIIPRARYVVPLETSQLKKLGFPPVINYADFLSSDDLQHHYFGLSPNAALYFFNKQLQPSQIKLQPCVFQDDYYFFNIFDTTEVITYPTLSQLLASRQKEVFSNTYLKYLDSTITKYRNTAIKLLTTIQTNTNANFTQMAEKLTPFYQYYHLYLDSFEGISLDKKYTLRQNINIFYQKAKKYAASIAKLQNQLLTTQDHLTNLEDIRYNYLFISQSNDPQIESLLIPYGYAKNHQSSKIIKKGNYLSRTFQGVNIYIGKNAPQNEELIKKSPDFYWFHLQNAPGAHLIYASKTITPEAIVFCANLVASFSLKTSTPHVAVDYTILKNVKRIANLHTFKVSIKNYQTIIIDYLAN
ncbi:MAG: NFACT RNA binding domain-containing protein [Acholeplasmatales bacterium]|jgi:predicted ribosome quality control (RQC) complex YloA/Tae2 family protein|nr:NFACT RNA binding domain-containing protein [Acholeplasmatales bacterium]